MNYAIIALDPLTLISEFWSIPDPVLWPDGSASHAVAPGFQYEGWKFVAATVVGTRSEFYDAAPPNTLSFDGALLTVTPTFTAHDLASVKVTLRTRVDAAAELIRQGTITSGPGQAMVYLQKQAEAQACLKDGAPDTANYPLLAATLGIEGATVTDIAKLVAATSAAWTTKAAQVERVRLAGKFAVDAAITVDAAAAAFSALVWP